MMRIKLTTLKNKEGKNMETKIKLKFSVREFMEKYDGNIYTLLDEFRDMEISRIVLQCDKNQIVCY